MLLYRHQRRIAGRGTVGGKSLYRSIGFGTMVRCCAYPCAVVFPQRVMQDWREVIFLPKRFSSDKRTNQPAVMRTPGEVFLAHTHSTGQSCTGRKGTRSSVCVCVVSNTPRENDDLYTLTSGVLSTFSRWSGRALRAI